MFRGSVGFKKQELPITTPGVYHNPTLGLLSYSSDGSTWYTIADKNLGAISVWNYGDTLNTSNCGNYFQWGNNYPFVFSSAAPSTSSTAVDASTYGPGNYYSSSTMITGNKNWDSTSNRNLWGDLTNTLEARRGPCSEGFHVPTNGDISTLVSVAQSFGLGIWQGINQYFLWPYAGSKSYNGGPGTPSSLGSYGKYWTSSTKDSYRYAFGSYEGEDYHNNNTWVSTNVFTIRPFKNESVQPTTRWVKLI